VIWFHTPHLPIVAGEEYRAMYKNLPGLGPDYFGAITAMDEQIGRLHAALRVLGVDRKTMLWFASDNGPEGPEQSDERNGSAGPFRGRKRSLYEGGVRVPAFLVWPEKVPLPVATDIPASTLDYAPTTAEALGVPLAGEIDGVSLMPLIEGGRMAGRNKAIGFETPGHVALSDDRWKIVSKTDDDGNPMGFELYDLLADPGETTDLAAQEPSVVESMAERLAAWRASCAASSRG
jgi:arylsulfatase A-like enzyme